MKSYKQMWMSLRNGLSMQIRDYEKADNISGLDDYALTELDAWCVVWDHATDGRLGRAIRTIYKGE